MKKALFIGFGSVGQALARMLLANADRLQRQGFGLRAIGVFTRTKGNVADDAGLDLGKLLGDVESGNRFGRPACGMTSLEACERLDYDVLVEISPLSIGDCGEPALSHIRAALGRGRDVVTANKGPIAFGYGELKTLAAVHGGRLLFESTVMDGAPVFNLAALCMKGNEITAFSGILNSTTNYILTRMEEGVALDAATADAIRLGIAEADPGNDIDGWDAAAKTAVLARVLLGADVTPLDVSRSGIGDMSCARLQDALKRGKRWKLICRGWRDGDMIRASVGLEELDKKHLFAGLDDFDSAICIESRLMCPNYIVQKGPSPMDTAYGLLEDLLSL